VWQTLFHIPHDRFDIPVFGVGWALAAFLVASGVYLAVQIRRHGVDQEVRGYLPIMLLVSLAIIFVLPQLEEVVDGKPEGIPIRGYGVMMLLGIVAGVSLAAYRAQRMGVDPDVIYSVAFYAFVCGVVGARAFYIIQYWGEFQQETLLGTIGAILNVTKGGLVVYGSLIGAIVAVAAFVHRHKVPALPLGDLIAPSLALGLALGRIGCLMNGCCFGGTSDGVWAMPFPPTSPVYERQVYSGELLGIAFQDGALGRGVIDRVAPGSPAAIAGLKPGDEIVRIEFFKGVQASSGCTYVPPANRTAEKRPSAELTLSGAGINAVPLIFKLPDRSHAVQPTQIYSSINAFLLCGLLLAYYPFRRRDGEVAALLLTVYPCTRILLEYIRIDEAKQFATHLTISQIVSLVMLAFAAVLWIYVLRQPKGTAWPPEHKQMASGGGQAPDSGV
jgi:phosphatidylglycerol:prolipoprotein diacylglycerol transferase